MSNSLYVPLAEMPKDLNQLRAIISKAFDLFHLPPPRVKFYKSLPEAGVSLLGQFIMIDGDASDSHCWVSFNECLVDISEKDGYNYIADVTTRESWIFAGMVAYGICLFSEYIVFNDSGELDGQEKYTAESLRATLEKFLI